MTSPKTNSGKHFWPWGRAFLGVVGAWTWSFLLIPSWSSQSRRVETWNLVPGKPALGLLSAHSAKFWAADLSILIFHLLIHETAKMLLNPNSSFPPQESTFPGVLAYFVLFSRFLFLAFWFEPCAGHPHPVSPDWQWLPYISVQRANKYKKKQCIFTSKISFSPKYTWRMCLQHRLSRKETGQSKTSCLLDCVFYVFGMH